MKNEISKYKNRFLQLLESEIGNVKPLLNEELPYSPFKSVTQTNPKVKPQTKENINPKNLKIGDGGTKKPKLKNDVIALQQKLINFGCLTTDTGKPTGYFGNKTNTSLIKYNQQGPCNKVNGKDNDLFSNNLLKPKNKGDIVRPTQKISTNFSPQVLSQINYLKNNNLLKNERFTVVDDKNSKVHSFNYNYGLYKSYDVITGKNSGDKLKTQTMTDWVINNWKNVFSKVFESGLKDTSNYIDNCYFRQKEWKIKNTPSGVFKRAGTIKNFMNDFLATTFIEEDYGKRFITWETCNGDTIPFGFHGTKSIDRLKVLELKNNKNQSCTKRNMSFGCINFKENDILDINNFITSGQISIWLPDETNDIVEIPKECL
jgi:hypothetical protein